MVEFEHPIQSKRVPAVSTRIMTRSQSLYISVPTVFKMPKKITSRRSGSTESSSIKKPVKELHKKTEPIKRRKAANSVVVSGKLIETAIAKKKEPQDDENRGSAKQPNKRSIPKTSKPVAVADQRDVLESRDLNILDNTEPVVDMHVFNSKYCLRKFMGSVDPNSFKKLEEASASSSVCLISSDESGS